MARFFIDRPIVAIVIAVNVAAFTLFFRTIGGVARHSR